MGGATTQHRLLMSGVGVSWWHGVGVGSQGGLSPKHVGVDKQDGAELNSDEPDTDSAGCGGGASEADPALTAARCFLVSRRHVYLEDGL